MAQFTTDLGKRDPKALPLTKTEAAAMLQLGFRFSEFNTEYDRYQVSRPYKTIENVDRGIITFEQEG